MARLIDADKINYHEHTECMGHGDFETVRTVTDKEIEEIPTVDATPVVRCRECVYWKPTGSKAGNSFSDMEYIGGCEFTKYCRRESDFCSYGERKDCDGNG